MQILGILGILMAFIGWVWLIVTAIQTGKDTTDKAIWAIVCAIGCPPIGGIIFFIVKKQGMIPLLVMIVGGILAYLGGFLTFNANMGGL